MDYNIFIYIIFGVTPSLIWLFYYLRKDLHPEPKRMILRMFLWGALITLPVFFVQIGLSYLLALVDLDPLLRAIIYWFLVISLSEEIFKYLIVRIKITNSTNLDEPLDIMLYMVIAALGFAALENVLYLFAPIKDMSFNDLLGRTFTISFIRFIGSTFLHTLCSAVVGYAMAMSFCQEKRKYLYLTLGIIVAMVLHGLYDFSIMTLDGYYRIMTPVITMLVLALLVYAGFEKLKKMKGVCKVN